MGKYGKEPFSGKEGTMRVRFRTTGDADEFVHKGKSTTDAFKKGGKVHKHGGHARGHK